MISKIISGIFFFTGILFAAFAGEVVCTAYPIWLLTREITGNLPDIKLVLLQSPDGSCVHEYTPAPRDIKKLSRAKLLIANGMGLDKTMTVCAERANRKLPIIYASHPQDTFNEHNFASPDTALRMAERICQELCKYFPEHAKQFRNNLAHFSERINQLATEFHNKNTPEKTVIIQSGLFCNLARFYGVNVVKMRNERSDILTAGKLKELSNIGKNRTVSAIFAEKTLNDKALEQLSRTTKLPVIKLDMILTGPENPPEDHYFQQMRKNLSEIRRVLEK